jgi:transcriptional regulator with XRE-family HTH domain
MEPAQSIDLNLKTKLKDKAYRQRFFLAQDSAHIAEQLISLRKRRGLNQTQVAELAGTKQPAISRAEQADYQNRKLETLRAIVEALDGRLRVIIEPAEDVLGEYETETTDQTDIARIDVPAEPAASAKDPEAQPKSEPETLLFFFSGQGINSAKTAGASQSLWTRIPAPPDPGGANDVVSRLLNFRQPVSGTSGSQRSIVGI